MTSLSLAAAAGLTVIIGIVHSWLGEIKIVTPLVAGPQRAPLMEKSAFARKIVRFAWHITTLAWWGFAAILAAFASGPLGGHDRIVLAAISATFIISGLISLIISRGRHIAWPLFFAIGGLSVAPLF
jgi:hypothetical protein